MKELQELAKQKGCSLKGARRKLEIQERLLEFCFPKLHAPTEVQTELFSEERTSGNTANMSKPNLVCLPLLTDEFLFMWEGGLICHPAVMSEMARETGVELEARIYHSTPELAWEKVAQIPGEVRLYLSNAPQRLTVDLAASFQSLVRIEVDSLGFKEELIRRIKQTHQRLDNELNIQVGSSLSTEPLKVQTDSTWSVLESEGFIRMKRMDSIIGAIAVSSYVERLMLVEGKLNTSIMDLGWLGSAVFQTDIWRTRLEKESGNVEKLRSFADAAIAHSELECEWQLDIRDELSAWRNGEDDFPLLWSKFAHALPKEVSEAIAKDMRRGLIRDVMLGYSGHLTPWLIYVLLLWKHKGIRNRSSNASQSLLHTLIDFSGEGVVSGQDAVIIAAHHGWHMGYQLCMASPVDWTSVYGGPSHWWSLKLSSKALARISSALINKKELIAEKESPNRLSLNGGLILAIHETGVVRRKDSDIEELVRVCKTESKGWNGVLALLPSLLHALKSLRESDQKGNLSLGVKEIDELTSAVASELESDDKHCSKRRLVKMILAGWRSTKHQQDG